MYNLCNHFIHAGESLFTNPANTYGSDMLIDGRSPKWGEIFRNPQLASTLRVGE